MKSENEKQVSQVMSTYDYSLFTVLPENRGHTSTKGIKERKIKALQRMIDDGTWIDEIAKVRVNEKYEIIDGAHTFEVSRRNKKPVRYEVMHDEKFNAGTKRDKIGAVYSINSTTTSWSSSELFNAAVQTKAPLAICINQIIQDNDNYFNWTDIMALLERKSIYFNGAWRGITMAYFEKKDLVEMIQHESFTYELNFFIKLNMKARIAPRKGVVLKAAYDILWYARQMIEPRLMRKALQSLPDALIQSERSRNHDTCKRMILQHYNKSQGQNVEVSTVMYALKHGEEAALEIV